MNGLSRADPCSGRCSSGRTTSLRNIDESYPPTSVAAAIIAKPDDFWVARAKRQLALSTYRLVFRAAYYPDVTDKQQLPLPPDEVFNITLARADGGPAARRARVQNHDYVLVDYTLDTQVITDEASPGTSEPALATVGGMWDEPFTFPVDPASRSATEPGGSFAVYTGANFTEDPSAVVTCTVP